MQASRPGPFRTKGKIPFGTGAATLDKGRLPDFIDLLLQDYEVVGPRIGAGEIVLDHLKSPADLATGYRDIQTPGIYRFEKVEPNGTIFTYVNGHESPKKFLHPSRFREFVGQPRGSSPGPALPEERQRPLAFFALRPCDRQAIHVLDLTFLAPYPDYYYRRNREGALLVVLNCTNTGNLCFCVSMGTGPRADTLFDIAMTELEGRFLLEVGSDRGAAMVEKLGARPATAEDLMDASRALAHAAAHMGRQLDTIHLVEILQRELENPYWDVMKDWCIGCGNCTAVCPTCFCYEVADGMDFTTGRIYRERRWDVCFNWQFTEMHGCNMRSELKQRYRHWCCHKLSYWVDQYGVFGCVGCGRCLTWCPVKIDITEVATTIRRNQR
ncbi:MAG: 4Fe-4S dicluster domain-containing protein [Chloroflexi bacterium]|nr:4Fe-4S dicluster domain-containing protein [Chloroflexota bacterium]